MTVFRWTVVLAGLSALALGCAPGTTPPAGARENTVDLVAGRGARTMTIERDDPTRAGRLSVPPDQAWDALVRTYEMLEIPVDTYVAGERRIGSSAWRTRRIAGRSMSHWVDCGQGLSGVYANTHRVTLVIGSVVEPEADGSLVYTRLEGTARSVDGASAHDLRCTTTGELELLITRTVGQLAQMEAGTP